MERAPERTSRVESFEFVSCGRATTRRRSWWRDRRRAWLRRQRVASPRAALRATDDPWSKPSSHSVAIRSRSAPNTVQLNGRLGHGFLGIGMMSISLAVHRRRNPTPWPHPPPSRKRGAQCVIDSGDRRDRGSKNAVDKRIDRRPRRQNTGNKGSFRHRAVQDGVVAARSPHAKRCPRFPPYAHRGSSRRMKACTIFGAPGSLLSIA